MHRGSRSKLPARSALGLCVRPAYDSSFYLLIQQVGEAQKSPAVSRLRVFILTKLPSMLFKQARVLSPPAPGK